MVITNQNIKQNKCIFTNNKIEKKTGYNVKLVSIYTIMKNKKITTKLPSFYGNNSE